MLHHRAPISGISLHKNKYVATAGYDNQIILWDAKNRQPLQRCSHDHLVNHCDFSPDGSLLVSASSDGTARLWSVPELKLLNVLTSHTDDVMQSRFCPNGEKFATCSYDSSLSVYDKYGTFLRSLNGHKGLIESFDWTDDGKSIISCGTDGTIRTWDAENGICSSTKTTQGGDMDALLVLSDDSYVIGNNEGQLNLFINESIVQSIQGHKSSIKNIVRCKTNRSNLISLGYDQQVIVWKLHGERLQEIGRTEYPKEIWARSADFYDDSLIVFATFGSCYATWNSLDNQWNLDGYTASRSLNRVHVSDGSIYAIGDAGVLYTPTGFTGGPQSLCNFLAKIGNSILTGGQTGEIFDITHKKIIYEHHAPLNCSVLFEINGIQYTAIGSYSGHILLFTAGKTGPAVLVGCYKTHNNAIKGIAWRDKCIYSGSADGEIAITSAVDFQILERITQAHNGILNDLCAFQDGIATVSRDLTLKLWGSINQTFTGRHINSIKCIACNDAGNVLATGSYGGTVDIFDIKSKSWLGDIQKISETGISSLAWHEGDNCFYGSSYDGEIYKIDNFAII